MEERTKHFFPYDCLKGPMWRQIRGLGLAYSYTMQVDPDSGMIFFVLSQSSDLVKGYEESLAIVNSHLNGTSKFESELFESATSGLVFETIERVKTVANTTGESRKAYYSNTDMTFTQELLKKISQVTNADLDRVGEKYLKPLFDCSVSKCAVCCHPNKVDEIVKGFQQISRDLTKLSSLEDELLTKY
ncbi:hypothetical protein JTE90_006783 [Oedothorax gibbosus]|uniref:Uncharacterized protein n=1 Tax=Oedothorax gibbosus TaxID=931172 RepID=A0AAV6VPV0_9ARAC|nr:hypothetical protein JTE90_006783 [Oedothorax gibbosus]